MKDIIAWFGLKRIPFDKNIKPKDVLDTDPFKECTARLDYIKRRGGILLLTGDPGVGKTLVLRRYVDSLNENLFKPCYTPLSTLSRADLLYHLNRLLGLPPRLSKSAVYGQIQQAVIESKEQMGKTIVLIIDEAHLLQTELNRVMEFAVMEPFNQRIAMRYHLPGLTHDETQIYINHHLNLAGAKEPILDQKAMDAVFELSFGIPRKIGSITEQALTYAMFDGKRTVSADMLIKLKRLQN